MPLAEAVNVLKGFDGTKFDQSVEVAMRLGVDQAQADQIVRGSIVLPHGIGKQQRVVVFAKGQKADEASEAGADHVGEEELAEKIKGGWTDFDVCIAAPDMMKLVGPLGKVLGPRGPDALAPRRHRDARRGHDGQGVQGRQSRVPQRQSRATSKPPSASSASTRRSWSRTFKRSSTR